VPDEFGAAEDQYALRCHSPSVAHRRSSAKRFRSGQHPSAPAGKNLPA